MPTAKNMFYHFSKETTFHGFKRLWVGSWVRWPFWSVIIMGGIVMSIYQIKNKMDILIANPLNININMEYKDELEFPTITVCNKLKLRVSFIVNNSILLNLLHVMVPQGSNINITKENIMDLQELDQKWTAKEFFRLAGLPKEQAILWCLLPNGDECTLDDFEQVITDEGYCYTLRKKVYIKEAGRGNGLKILFNLAQYERIVDADSMTGTRLVIHEHKQDPMPSKGYDLMPGYQVAIVIRKTINTQIGNCEAENPLSYYDTYTYPACRLENKLTDAAMKCQCKPYTLPTLKKTSSKNDTIDKFPECSLFQHFTCVQRIMEDFAIVNASAKRPKTASSLCVGECIREEFEQELYYNFFRDNTLFAAMISSKEKMLQESHQTGLDASAFLAFYRQMDSNYQNLVDASKGYESLIVKKKLVPPYGTIADYLFSQLSCFQDMGMGYYVNKTKAKWSKKSKKRTDVTKIGGVIENIKHLQPEISSITVSDVFNFAYSLVRIHLEKCPDDKEICSLAALYDMLNVRNQLSDKKHEVDLLMSEQVSKLTDSVEKFFGKRNNRIQEILNGTDSNDEDPEELELKKILDYYILQVSTCLRETSRTYHRILISGQPNMKTSKTYYSFLNDLHSVNKTIYGICKNGGLSIEPRFNVTNMEQLSRKIIKIMAKTEAGSTKASQFNAVMAELLDKMEKKVLSYDYNEKVLKQSLFDIATIDGYMKQYLSQTKSKVYRKSEFYKALYSMKGPFQRGLNHYKTTVTKQLREMDEFFDTFIDKMIKAYPTHDSSEIHQLLHDTSFDEMNSSYVNDPMFSHIVCLKKAKAILTHIGSADEEATSLDSYKQNVDSLVSSLKTYAEEIGSLKNFYQNNLGLVKIYFRDMGVKESTQERAYDFLSFLCDIGGIVGLWLGGSIVSLIEIFDLVFFENIEAICHFNERKNKRKSKFQDIVRQRQAMERGDKQQPKPSESCLESLL